MGQRICTWAGVREDAIKFTLKGLGNVYIKTPLPFAFGMPDPPAKAPGKYIQQKTRVKKEFESEFIRVANARKLGQAGCVPTYEAIMAQLPEGIKMGLVMKGLPNYVRIDILEHFVGPVEVAKRGGYYRGLKVQNTLASRQTLRDLGFCTGTSDALRYMGLLPPMVADVIPELEALIEKNEILRAERWKLADLIGLELNPTKGHRTRLVNLIDGLLDAESAVGFEQGIEGTASLKKLPLGVKAQTRIVYESYQLAKAAANSQTGELKRVKSRELHHWEVFVQTPNLEAYVQPKRMCLPEELRTLTIATIDGEMPLYKLPKEYQVTSHLCIVIHNGGSIQEAYVLTLANTDKTELFVKDLDCRDLKINVVSLYNKALSYSEQGEALYDFAGDLLEKKHVDLIAAFNAGYDLTQAAKGGLLVKGRKPVTEAVMGFQRRMGLEELMVMDLYGWFRHHEGHLPNAKLFTILSHFLRHIYEQMHEDGLIDRPYVEKKYTYKQLEDLERLMLGMRLEAGEDKVPTLNPKRAMDMMLDYVGEDTSPLPKLIEAPEAMLFDKLPRIQEVFKLSLQEATASVTAARRLYELQFLQQNSIHEKSTIKNHKWHLQQQHRDTAALRSIVNSVLKGASPSTRGNPDTVFHNPGLYRQVVVSHLPWAEVFRGLVEGVSYPDFDFQCFANYYIKELFATYAAYAAAKQNHPESPRTKKLWGLVKHKYGMESEEITRTLVANGREFGSLISQSGLIGKNGEFLFSKEQVPGLVQVNLLPHLVVTPTHLVYKQYGVFKNFSSPKDKAEAKASLIEKRTVNTFWHALRNGNMESFTEAFSRLAERASAGRIAPEEVLFKEKSSNRVWIYEKGPNGPRRAEYSQGFDYQTNMQVFFGAGTRKGFEGSRLGRYLNTPEIMRLIGPVLNAYPELFGPHCQTGGPGFQYHTPSEQPVQLDLFS
jgi:hypothetical protein